MTVQYSNGQPAPSDASTNVISGLDETGAIKAAAIDSADGSQINYVKNSPFLFGASYLGSGSPEAGSTRSVINKTAHGYRPGFIVQYIPNVGHNEYRVIKSVTDDSFTLSSPISTDPDPDNDYMSFLTPDYIQVVANAAKVAIVPQAVNQGFIQFADTGISSWFDCSGTWANYSLVVSGEGAAATSWTVKVEVMIIPNVWSPILTHSNTDGDGALKSITGIPANSVRVHCTAVTLGGASRLNVGLRVI